MGSNFEDDGERDEVIYLEPEDSLLLWPGEGDLSSGHGRGWESQNWEGKRQNEDDNHGAQRKSRSFTSGE